MALRAYGPFERVLELACGTGNWTGELLRIGRRITAIDASLKMLEINRRKITDASVTYQCADIFLTKLSLAASRSLHID